MQKCRVKILLQNEPAPTRTSGLVPAPRDGSSVHDCFPSLLNICSLSFLTLFASCKNHVHWIVKLVCTTQKASGCLKDSLAETLTIFCQWSFKCLSKIQTQVKILEKAIIIHSETVCFFEDFITHTPPLNPGVFTTAKFTILQLRFCQHFNY